MKTREEVERLKENWLADPIYDIEDTEGFEEHKERLKEFSIEQKKKWDEVFDRKEQAKKDRFNNLKLHETFILDDGTNVLKVKGGWVYSIIENKTEHNGSEYENIPIGVSSVFVPNYSPATG